MEKEKHLFIFNLLQCFLSLAWLFFVTGFMIVAANRVLCFLFSRQSLFP